MEMTLSADDWNDIENTFQLLIKSDLTKVEGKKWIMYKVGSIIRIDVQTK